MRTFAALALAALATPLGFAGNVRPQAAPSGPIERVPNKDSKNAFPRWMAYTDVSGPNFYRDLSLGIDSRDRVHMVVLEYGRTPNQYRIVHRTDAPATRGPDGFSKDPVVIQAVNVVEKSVSAPDLAVASDDTLHAVWEHALNESPDSRVDVYYSMRGPSGAWSAPLNLTDALVRIQFFRPQVKVDSTGLVHIVAGRDDRSLSGAPALSLHYMVFNPGQAKTPGTNPRVSVIPNAFPDHFSFGGPRFDLTRGTSPDQPWVVWEELVSASERQVFYAEGNYSAGSPVSWPGGKQSFGTAAWNAGPDVAIDSANMPHFAWVGDANSATFEGQHVLHKKRADAGATTVSGDSSTFETGPFNQARLAFDSRGQIHVAWTGLSSAARVKNPKPDQLDTNWRRQERAFAPLHSDPAYPGYRMSSPREMLLSRNDVIHVVDSGSNYTRTLEYGVGSRDPAALAGVLPGGSVNVTSGNLSFGVGLFSTQGVGPSQSCGLGYNSLDAYAGLVDRGWRLNYEVFLIRHRYFPDLDSNFTLIRGDGRPIHFKWSTQHFVYLPEEEFGSFDKLEVVGSEFEITSKFGDKMTFDADGKLREIKELTGNYLELKWNDPAGGGRLTEIRDLLGNGGPGRTTSLEYETAAEAGPHDRRLKKITDPRSKSYEFSYSGPRLSQVKFLSHLSQPTWTLEYYPADDFTKKDAENNPAPERIGLPKIIRTPRGTADSYGWTCNWLPDNRLAAVKDPLQVALTLSYVNPVDPATAREATLKNRRQFDMKYVVEPVRALVLEIHDPTKLAMAPGIKEVKRTFDKYGNLRALEDRWGFRTEWDFFTDIPGDTPPASPLPVWVFDNLKEVRRPKEDGTGVEKVAAYADYTALSRAQTVSTFAKQFVGAPLEERITRHEFDLFGRVTKTTFPKVTRPDTVVQDGVFVRFEYNGTRKQLTLAFNEEGRSTTYSDFDSKGLPGRVLREGGDEPELFVRDELGNLLEHKLPTGGGLNDPTLATKYQRDGLHRVEQMTDAKGRITTYLYNLDSQRETVDPPAGGNTEVRYDRRGFPENGSDADNPGGWSQLVDANGNVTTYTNPKSGVTTSQYDPLDRMTLSNAPDVTTVNTFDMQVGSLFASETTVGGRKTKTEFDARGRVKKSTANDDATVTENFYDEQDQLVASQVKFNAAVQTCTISLRDARDRVHRVVVSPAAYSSTISGISTYTIYNKAGSVIREVDPLGDVSNTSLSAPHKTHYVRDARERVDQVIDGKGIEIRKYKYGDDDLVTEVLWPDPSTEGTGMITLEKRTYTALKELKSSKNGSGHGVDVEYGTLPGQVTKTRDARLVENSVEHHPDTQRPKTVTRASNAGSVNGGASETRLAWKNGLPDTTTVWNPQTGSYASEYGTSFDNSYRQMGSTAPLQAPTSILYQPTTGDLEEVKSIGATGSRNVKHQRDALGRAFRSDWTGVAAGFQTRAFNGLSLVEATQDQNGRREMIWDNYRLAPKDETLIRSGAITRLQHHEIDNAGNAVSFTDTENQAHATPVDANNQVEQLAYAGGTLCSFTYTPGQLVKTCTLRGAGGAPIATTTKYRDSLGREWRSVTTNSQGKIVSDYRRTFTVRDEVETETLGHLGVTLRYTYTPRGELERQVIEGNLAGQACPPFDNEYVTDLGGPESVPSSEVQGATSSVLAVPDLDAQFLYDPAGNRTSMIVNQQTTSFLYNAASQLTQEFWPDGKTLTHHYDDWGNEDLRTTVEDLGGGLTRTTEEHYQYNYLNTLQFYMKFVDASLVSHFEYGTWDDGLRASKRDVLANRTEYYMPRMGQSTTVYESLGAASPLLKDTHAAMGLDAVKTRIASDGVRRHHLSDGVGTLGTSLANDGSVMDTVVRRAFGELHAGSTAEKLSGGLAGSQLDDETGLCYMRYRMYDPRVGRWTQPDPIPANRVTEHYLYADNQPSGNRDPRGQYVELSQEEDEELGHQGKGLILQILNELFGGQTRLKWKGRRLAGFGGPMDLLYPAWLDDTTPTSLTEFLESLERPAEEYAELASKGVGAYEDLYDWTRMSGEDRTFLDLRRAALTSATINAAILEEYTISIYTGPAGKILGKALGPLAKKALRGILGAAKATGRIGTAIVNQSAKLARLRQAVVRLQPDGSLAVQMEGGGGGASKELLYRGVPSSTERGRMAMQGVVEPRGSSHDYVRHVIGEDVAADVTSWTTDPRQARRFGDIILTVEKDAVKHRMVPHPMPGLHPEEAEVLLRGRMTGLRRLGE